MAQLRYTRAIACGAFVTAGLVGVYVYKKRRSKKNLNHQNSPDAANNTSDQETNSNTTIKNEDSIENSLIQNCESNKLSSKHETDSISEIAQGLGNFEFDDDSLLENVINENTEIVEETCLAPDDQMPVLEPVIIQENISQELTVMNSDDLKTKADNSEGRTEQETSETLNWANAVDTVQFQSKDKDGCHVESDQGSEVNSEGSTDSGRGSTTVMPPSSKNSESENVQTVYQFEFPTKCVGKMIGKQGRSIKGLKEKTGAKVILEKIPYNRNYQNCIITGIPSEVDEAVREIQIRFPDVDVHRVVESQSTTPQQETVVPALQLCDEIVNDVMISNVITACHMFVQQPLHPSFRALPRLQTCMSSCYAQLHATPPLPQPIDVGMICAAPINESWCRAQVIDIQADSDEIDIKLVDYGGYARIDQASLRQIRSDFMSLPFQAVECYLAHIAPLEGEECFSEIASTFLDELAQSYSYLEAEIVAYSEDGLPMLELYFTDQGQRNMINKELVERGLVSWYEIPPSS